ncbi:unnamed protein product [Prorocentrum cordatum]|uniref:Uncharacterized protein n=1 Tax=Prorocentrum cordatum TaxID=2364126 RepID=A0ABN9RUB4_9DINO|nr:unnamed protein product [Polarella glacialis]
MLQSRLALPIAYPFNSAMLREGSGNVGALNPKDWKDSEIQRGLAHVTPIVTGMAKVAPLLKAAQALAHVRGGGTRHVAQDPAEASEETDIRIDHMRPQRLFGSGYGRGPGTKNTKTGKGYGWDDVCSGTNVDSPMNRMTVDPWDDTPELHRLKGRKFVSKTKWDKNKSGSQ